jgi:LmbE family N-acetylglucosaminyl deacetylase
MKKIVVIAAHPDDETLGAGGAMAKHVASGDSVSVLILGEGIASRKQHGEDYAKEKDLLRRDSRSALADLGVKDVIFLDFPDNSFDTVPLLELTRSVEKFVSEKGPEVVYTHHWGDLNVDHRRTFEAVLTACRPPSGVKRLLSFEVPSSTEWQAQTPANAFMPNLFVDISGSIEKKMKALEAYGGEMREYPHPRSPEGVRALAMYRGSQAFLEHAEAFEIIRHIERDKVIG